MNDGGITKENLLRHFPQALLQSESLAALAEIAAEVLARRRAELKRLLLYANTDEMDEALLDILANDFAVYWWDYNASIELKRRLIKTAPAQYRISGTTAAVRRQASANNPVAELEEWFEYGGNPGYFRLFIDLTNSVADPITIYSLSEAEEKLCSTKRESAHLESLAYMIRHVLLLGAKVERWGVHPPVCGTIYCGTYWEPSTLGHSEKVTIAENARPEAFAVSPELCGTLPQASQRGASVCGGVLAGGAAAGYAVTSTPAGIDRCGTLPEEA